MIDGASDGSTDAPADVVTGAFGFIGRRVTAHLLEEGRRVRTLTNHPDRPAPFADRVSTHPYSFDDRDALAAFLDGADTLYATYWERLPGADGTFDGAVENTRTLVRAAEDAGVRRIVHFSVSNADASSLPYYRGKAAAERVVREAEPSHAVLRPTLVFGRGELLVNNLAWFLRRFPAFTVPGDGRYPVRPVHVGDVADVAVARGAVDDDCPVTVAGPETFTFEELLRRVKRAVGARCLLVHAPPDVARAGVGALEWLLDDLIMTRDELRGVMNGLLATGGKPAGEVRFENWLDDHAGTLGTEYASFRQRYE